MLHSFDPCEHPVLHLQGSKTWKLYSPLQELPGTYSQDLSHRDIGQPTHTVTLRQGDLMYLPVGGPMPHPDLGTESIFGPVQRGVIHEAATATGDFSTHVTMSSYQGFAWGDLMRQLLPRVLDTACECEVTLPASLCGYCTAMQWKC